MSYRGERNKGIRQSERLRKRLYSLLSVRSVVPNQDGKLLQIREIKYPPKELTVGDRHLNRPPLERWAQTRKSSAQLVAQPGGDPGANG